MFDEQSLATVEERFLIIPCEHSCSESLPLLYFCSYIQLNSAAANINRVFASIHCTNHCQLAETKNSANPVQVLLVLHSTFSTRPSVPPFKFSINCQTRWGV